MRGGRRREAWQPVKRLEGKKKEGSREGWRKEERIARGRRRNREEKYKCVEWYTGRQKGNVSTRRNKEDGSRERWWSREQRQRGEGKEGKVGKRRAEGGV